MHSTPFSEIAAHVCGFVVGITAFAASGAFTHDHKLRLRIGVVASVLTNALIGGHINVLMRDFVGLILIRPISAYLGAKLLEHVTTTMGW